MASTNKTTNYDLSQYIGTDKPTYLTDYNQDMSKIDAGIHAAKSEADTNADSIGTLSSLTTTAKTSLVAAVNEVDADVATNTNNIATNTSNIATNTSAIGTLANLTTSSKTDLVVASNEINAKVGNLSLLDTEVKTSCVGAINSVLNQLNMTDIDQNTPTVTQSGTLTDGKVTIASNSLGTIAKIYGTLVCNKTGDRMKLSVISDLRPKADFTVNNLIIAYDANSSIGMSDVTIKTDGTIEFEVWNSWRGTVAVRLLPIVIFVKDFGDTPSPNPTP